MFHMYRTDPHRAVHVDISLEDTFYMTYAQVAIKDPGVHVLSGSLRLEQVSERPRHAGR